MPLCSVVGRTDGRPYTTGPLLATAFANFLPVPKLSHFPPREGKTPRRTGSSQVELVELCFHVRALCPIAFIGSTHPDMFIHEADFWIQRIMFRNHPRNKQTCMKTTNVFTGDVARVQRGKTRDFPVKMRVPLGRRTAATKWITFSRRLVTTIADIRYFRVGCVVLTSTHFVTQERSN